MTRNEAFTEWLKLMEGCEDSVDIATEKLQGQLGWLAHIPDGEYNRIDRNKVIAGMLDLYLIIRPLTAKYIDGE